MGRFASGFESVADEIERGQLDAKALRLLALELRKAAQGRSSWETLGEA